jgi:hypothetical protein
LSKNQLTLGFMLLIGPSVSRFVIRPRLDGGALRRRPQAHVVVPNSVRHD